MRTGFEVAMAQGFASLGGMRLGIIANQTSIGPDFRHISEILHEQPDVDLRALFSPEHGLHGSAPPGATEKGGRDKRTGLPVMPLYGLSGPALEQVFVQADVEAVVFDIQDVGARFYTYIWTLFDAMAACARLDLRVIVLDRPNPLGGEAVRGPVLSPQYASFLGRAPVALQHGMTVCELARFFNSEILPHTNYPGRPARLDVVSMQGWRRWMTYGETGLAWVPPSPNMPTSMTATVYPGVCLLEGTTLSLGRGTTTPFELAGAPDLDSSAFVQRLNDFSLPGVGFRETSFTPSSSIFSGREVQGAQMLVTDSGRFNPVALGVALLLAAKAVWPGFAWREEGRAIDRLAGTDTLRQSVDAGTPPAATLRQWSAETTAFAHVRRPYLLY